MRNYMYVCTCIADADGKKFLTHRLGKSTYIHTYYIRATEQADNLVVQLEAQGCASSTDFSRIQVGPHVGGVGVSYCLKVKVM